MDEIIYESVAVVTLITQSSVKINTVEGQSFYLKKSLFPEDTKLKDFVIYTLKENTRTREKTTEISRF
jgi:hypothetical protein